MTGRRSRLRLTAGLWFVAALLAWIAVAIRFTRRGEMVWTTVAAGLFCAAMGVDAWARARKAAARGE